MEEKIIPNPDVELKNYIIISQYLEKKEEDKDKDIEFELPTPETIEKLCEPQIVKNRLNFDFKKYSSFFEGDKLNLDKIESLKDTEKTKILLMFLGFINSKHDIYSLYDQEIEVYEEKRFIDNVPNYSIYLDYCIDYLKSIDKCFDSIQDFDTFMKILSEVGINIENQEKNDLYLKIKQDLFLSKGKNKILILIAPSNNFWIKSEKSSINEQNYDKKLNNYTNIFYNKNFIKKFMQQVVANPRCHFGLISSMAYRNLKACWDALEKLDNDINNLCPKNIIFIDQNLHSSVQDEKSKKKTFFRDMAKIVEYLKKSKGKNKDNEQDNTGYFDENNILILESELEKMTDSTRNNTIRLNIFNEEYLQKDEKGKKATDLDVDKFIDYLVKLLNDCGEDIRSYIKQNTFSNKI
jgi:hypothetical protein